MVSFQANYTVVDQNRSCDRPPYSRALVQFRPKKYLQQILSSLRYLPNRIDDRDKVDFGTVYKIRLPFVLVQCLDRQASLMTSSTIQRSPSVASSIEVQGLLECCPTPTGIVGCNQAGPSPNLLPSHSPSLSPLPWTAPCQPSSSSTVTSSLMVASSSSCPMSRVRDIIDLTCDSDGSDIIGSDSEVIDLTLSS